MYFVYILKSLRFNRHYVGCTNNLGKRLEQHNRGDNSSTRCYRPWEIVCYKVVNNQAGAFAEEKKIKSYKGGNAFKKIINGEVAEWSKATRC